MTDATPKKAVIHLMNGAAPERETDLASLWERYDPEVVLAADAVGITLKAGDGRITFDAKTMDVFWLIGFAGFRAIETYSPAVVLSAVSNQPVADLLRVDPGIDDVVRAYKSAGRRCRSLSARRPWPLRLGQMTFRARAPTAMP
jgi:hypothetical protein